jgi:hypothetical protein
LCYATITTLIYQDLPVGGDTIKNDVSRWSLLTQFMVLMVGKSVLTNTFPSTLLSFQLNTAEIGMDALIEKRDKITSYLEFILHEIDKRSR